MSAHTYLALDIGTSLVKAGVIDRQGNLLGSGSGSYPLLHPRPDWVEARPEDYWTAAVRSVRAAVQQTRDRLGTELSVGGIGASCQGETLLCLDRSGQPLGNAIVWLDNRAHAEAGEIGQAITPEELYSRTGQIESIATWPAAKLLWLRRHDPERFAATAHFALLGDWIAARLSGTLAAEVSLQSNTLLLDIQKRRWSDPSLELVGIEKTRLLSVVETGHILGGLTAEAAEAFNLPANIPVIAGSVDQVAAALGAGNIEPGQVTEMTGTALALCTTLTNALPERAAKIPIYLHARPGWFCGLCYLQTGGAVLRWLQETFSAVAAQPIDFGTLVSEASAIPAGSEGLMLLPHLAGETFPEFDMQAKGAIVGLTLRHGRAHIVRAALEAVAYGLRQMLGRLADLGIRPNEIRSLGGGAGNEIWRQIKADVCGLPIRRIDCPEAALLGIAMLIAVSIGDYDTQTQAVKHMTRAIDAARPVEARRRIYDQSYSEFLAVATQLRPFWHRPSQ